VATVVVGSYAVQFPMGGYLSWVLQFMVGLQDLGHDAWFVERSLGPGSCFDPVTQTMGDDCARGTSALSQMLEEHGMGDRWCFVDAQGRYHGRSREVIEDILRGADLFIDSGTHGTWDTESQWCGQRILVDGEPGATQVRMEQARRSGVELPRFDRYYTVGQNVGLPDCVIPTAGLRWQHLLYPVCTRLFPVEAPPEGAPFTTVMSWTVHTPFEFRGRLYGAKDIEFEKFMDLPRLTDAPIEVAIGGIAPRSRLQAGGWRVVDAHAVTIDLPSHRSYLRGSLGEFSVCKNSFVALRSGWVGDRLGAYLASGRPVVMQDTGFGDHLPCGAGLFAVSDAAQAAAAIESVRSGYASHALAARRLAEERFEATTVLGQVLADLGIPSPQHESSR
jgi:hypothetical protein